MSLFPTTLPPQVENALAELTDPELRALGDLLDSIWAARAVFAATAGFHTRALAFKTFPKSRATVVRTQRRRSLECAEGFAETALRTRPAPMITIAGNVVGVELVVAPERPGLLRSAAIELNTLRRLAAAETIGINGTLCMRVPKSLARIAVPTLEMLTLVAHGNEDALWAALRAQGGGKKLLAAENLPTELTAAQWAAEGTARFR